MHKHLCFLIPMSGYFTCSTVFISEEESDSIRTLRVGPTRTVFLEKLVGGPHAVSFPPIFQHFCRERRMGIFADVLAPLFGFLKIANKQGF